MKRNSVIFVVLVVLLVLLFGLDVCSGSMWLWPFGDHLSLMEQQILHAIRLPKALTAILAGASLSVAGLIMQTLFRNPLAGPYTLGITRGGLHPTADAETRRRRPATGCRSQPKA